MHGALEFPRVCCPITLNDLDSQKHTGVTSMPLHYARDGYTFHADAHTLVIEPGSRPVTLTRAELEQLGLLFPDKNLARPSLPEGGG